MAPIIRELTAKPVHPQVMTKPMAVPVMRGKASPTIASVVGKTGAIESPLKKDQHESRRRPVGPQHQKSRDRHRDRCHQGHVDSGGMSQHR